MQQINLNYCVLNLTFAGRFPWR